MIVRVNVVLIRTLVVDSNWLFDNLCGCHLDFWGPKWYYKNYTVKYQAVSAVKDLLTVIRKEANLTSLIKDESYNVSVLVTTGKGNGPYSVPIILTTNENSEYFETLFGIAKQIPSRLCFFASTIPSTTGSIRKTNYCVIHWIDSYSV